MNDFSWLSSFEGEYRAQLAFRPGVEALASGDYDCEIVDAAFDTINGRQILRLGIKAGTLVVERTYWFEEQRVINGLCADLLALGFDADKWGAAHGRPLATELPKAVAKLPGIRFRGSKRSREGIGKHTGKLFHDFYFQGRLGAPSPMPALGSDPPTAPALPSPSAGAEARTPPPSEAPIGQGQSDCPF